MIVDGAFGACAVPNESTESWKQRFQHWLRCYNRRMKWAERFAKACNNLARKLAKEAGLDPNLLGIHPHNAMVCYNAGRPWQGVDYDKVKEVVRLLDREWEANRIVDRWDKRVRGY